MKLKAGPSSRAECIKAWTEVGKDLLVWARIFQYPPKSEMARRKQSYRWEIVTKDPTSRTDERVICYGFVSVYKLAVKRVEEKRAQVLVQAIAQFDGSKLSEDFTSFD